MPRFLDHCIFCPNTDLSRTHIWPAWLDRLLGPSDKRLEELDNPHVLSIRASKLKLGSIFRQKPYLACVACNTGWMQKFEDEMVAFAPPIFTSPETEVSLDKIQHRIFAVWISLITVLAEFIDHRSSVCISEEERHFLKTRLIPPEGWTIVACSQDLLTWSAKYRHHSSFIGQFSSLSEYYDAVAHGRPNNCQISSFGMGKLFIQVFSCPNMRYVADFRSYASTSGLVQLWPLSGRLNPFSRGLTKFPTQTILKDNEVSVVADAYNERLKRLTQPPYFGGQNVPEV